MSIKSSVIDLIHSGIAGICIQTAEEFRADDIVAEVADKLKFEIKEWNLGHGWVDFKNKRPQSDTEVDINFCQNISELLDFDLDNKLIIFKNIDLVLKDDAAIARLQQLLNRIKKHHSEKSCVLLIGANITIPDAITSMVSIIYLNLPSADEINELIKTFCKKNQVTISRNILSRLSIICSGMSEITIIQSLKKATLDNRKQLTNNVFDVMLHEKEQSIKKSGILEFLPLNDSIEEIGGLENLKVWLKRKKRVINDLDRAKAFGISPPKGVLIAGMPGCGKSLTAKATGSLFQLPLVKLDIGSLLGKYVGESEANMKKALHMAEQVSPCVLWIDEIEKAFSGVAGSSGGGSEVTTRLFGLFLSWMQEKPSAVFVIATANNVSVLPPELLRKGRFDEIFYVDFPNTSERQKILEIHLKDKRTSKINYEQLAKKTEGYTGSDIEGLINDSLEKTFIQDGGVLSNEDIITTLTTITPLKESLKDSIEEFEKTFEKFKLKPASFSKDEHQQLLKDSKSSDPVTREMVAANENCPVEILEKLIDVNDDNVKKAVITNPNCPPLLLENIIQHHNPQVVNWSVSFTWPERSNMIDTELFELALNHPNLKEESIENLYTANKVSDKQLIEIVQKRKNLKILLKLFDSVRAKSPSNIKKGKVRAIYIAINSIISKRQKIIDIDDEAGENRQITFPYDGLVKDVIVLEGEKICAGQDLVKILVPKKALKGKAS